MTAQAHTRKAACGSVAGVLQVLALYMSQLLIMVTAQVQSGWLCPLLGSLMLKAHMFTML